MSNFKEVVIYYFSGTGNAKQVASWIAETASQHSVKAVLVDISKIDRNLIKASPSNTLIGFCSPTHGFNFPPIMLHFVFQFPTGHNQVFIINTRAGMRLKNMTVPGLSGIAQHLAAIILLIKGYKIIGMRPIDLPSNWISLHPGLKQKPIESLFRKFEKISVEFAGKMLKGQKDFRALYELPVDILISPLALGYYLIGRYVFAKSFYASRQCDRCSLCIKECPVGAIRIVNERLFWTYKCESCMHCMNNCPEQAIQTAHGFIIGLIIFVSMAMQSIYYIFLDQFRITIFTEHSVLGTFARFCLSTFVMFGSLIVGYWFVHSLRKLIVFDLIIKYTSLTTFKFWRRYKYPDRVQKK
jgi:ferredoxin